jgi:hypothetical protein
MKLCAMTHAHEAGTTGRQGRRCGGQSIVTFNGDIASSEGRREKTIIPACGPEIFYNRFLEFQQHRCVSEVLATHAISGRIVPIIIAKNTTPGMIFILNDAGFWHRSKTG